MNKLLAIVGPTATGKTALAAHLAKKFNGELVSADSRQIYKYMDIGTGKEIEKYGRILGYDLVLPDEEFSVSQYIDFARAAISQIYLKNKLPILVGGTGFYISGVIDGVETANIPKNKQLRSALEGLSVKSLQEKLKKLNLKKFNSLNASDVNNPRRLIRAIEVALSGRKPERQNINYDVLFIGLKLPKEELEKRIKKRVDERIKMGFEKEVEFLKEKGFFKYAPMKTLGYKDWPDVDKWKKEECKYAKRQMVWFKKDARIHWFDLASPKLRGAGVYKEVENYVRRWHNLTNA